MDNKSDWSGAVPVPPRWIAIILVVLCLSMGIGIAFTVYAVTAKNEFLGIVSGGATGSLIHSLRSFWWYVGNRKLCWSWIPLYIALPFMGAALALFVSLLIRGGALHVEGAADSSIFYTVGLAGLVGLFSELALWKLREVAAAIFGKPPAGKDTVDIVGDPAGSPPQDAQSATNPRAKMIIDKCESLWEANKADSNAFVRSVANAIRIQDIPVTASADGIVTILQADATWTKLNPGDHGLAKQAADAGKFVIGALTAADLGEAGGQVAVVVAGPLDRAAGRFPAAYWGKANSTGQKNSAINNAFPSQGIAKVQYFVKEIPAQA